jgi:hypothetical protein
MTIAACSVTPEGVVLGADSTSTVTMGDGSQRYLNNEQKIFEVGASGTLGVVTWGLGRIGNVSHRNSIAALDDDLLRHPPSSVSGAADRFAQLVWGTYDHTLRAEIDGDKAVVTDPKATPEAKKKAAAALEHKVLGFCLAGHWLPDREPQAYEIVFDPNLTAPPVPRRVTMTEFWGVRLFVYRVLGVETSVIGDIVASGKWSGTPQELEAMFMARRTPLHWPVPLREAIDSIHALLHMTIKVMKFTAIPPVCGGHIELAAITTDRRFRWITHKTLDTAIDVPLRQRRGEL